MLRWVRATEDENSRDSFGLLLPEYGVSGTVCFLPVPGGFFDSLELPSDPPFSLAWIDEGRAQDAFVITHITSGRDHESLVQQFTSASNLIMKAG